MQLIFFISGYFLHFYLPNGLKNQKLKNMKKIPGDIIILHMYTKNYDQMIHGSWVPEIWCMTEEKSDI